MAKELSFADILKMSPAEYAKYLVEAEAAKSPEERAAEQEELRLLHGGEKGDGYI